MTNEPLKIMNCYVVCLIGSASALDGSKWSLRGLPHPIGLCSMAFLGPFTLDFLKIYLRGIKSYRSFFIIYNDMTS